MASSASAVETRSPSIVPIKERLEAYLRSFNRRDPSEYCKFYAEDIHVHLPAFPPVNSRTELEAMFRQGLSFFTETIRPTDFIVGEKAIAMEAKMQSVANLDIDFGFPFTGKTYKKGEEFVYEIVVHYEFNDDGLISGWRAFSVVQYPDPGAGIKKEILPGW
ncbi:hypothetical protein MMC31_004214 [Peltigera leucophlebia]|nr:hypothetical protein [Peltigera leucophlebia]